MKTKQIILPIIAVVLPAILSWAPSNHYSKTNIADDGRIIQIPVVFHVLYVDSAKDNGINDVSRDNGNSSEYIPREKVLAELADLDNDCQMKNPDVNIVSPNFKNVIGNPKVHFSLKSIVYLRIRNWGSLFESSNTSYLHSLSPVVDPEHCLNVYIGKIKFDHGGTDGVTPVRVNNSSQQNDDAVNLSYLWVGLHYRLLTHETGHWLGLWHTFDERQETDGITDIPVQHSFTDGNCSECPPDVREQRSLDPNFQHTNYNNFMDYSGCRVMFSVMQSSRIRYVVQNFRSDIWNSSATH